MHAALVAVLKKKITVKRSEILLSQVILKYVIRCTISAVLRGYISVIIGMIARSQLAILDYNSGIGLKQAQTKDG